MSPKRLYKKMNHIKIAIAGNPNSGKTTLFNALTGSHQQVGNWPGVTVERLEGSYKYQNTKVSITDLPGIYSFSAYSIDETIAREHILNDKPDLVINVLDATNLERNLFLTTQLLEMKVPMVVVLNMMDLANRRRIKIEIEHLSQHLDCPVIPVVASKNKGIQELRSAIADIAEKKLIPKTNILYDSVLEKSIHSLSKLLSAIAEENHVNDRWLAIKLIEKDELALKLVTDKSILDHLNSEITRVEKHTGEDMDIVVADGRYGFIHGLARDVVKRDNQIRQTISDKLDKVMLNRILGIPIFLAIMYLVFAVTINFGTPFIDFFDKLCGTIFVDGIASILSSLNSPDWLIVFLANGIGGGIQTVSTFIPPIFLIFLCLSILEDSGYMARAAFVMDRSLRTIGLPGKAFIPMLVGFGCNVPAILATRTLENNRDRILTILINPFMSCSARLPVYTLFAAVFFPTDGGIVLFSLYFGGIILAIASGLLFKNTILQGEPATFVMELPPYHFPTFRGIMFHTWKRLSDFIVRAGRVILGMVIVLSLFSSIGTDGTFGNDSSEKSLLTASGKAITPILHPIGITQENWPASVGLLSGVFAKEAIVGTLDTLYSRMDLRETTDIQIKSFDFWKGISDAFTGIPASFRKSEDISTVDASTSATAKQTFNSLSRYFDGKVGAFAYLIFILIYSPCLAAITAIYKETNFRWAAFSVTYLTCLAWIAATITYQGGTFMQHPSSSLMWLLTCVIVLISFYAGLIIKTKKIKK